MCSQMLHVKIRITQKMLVKIVIFHNENILYLHQLKHLPIFYYWCCRKYKFMNNFWFTRMAFWKMGKFCHHLLNKTFLLSFTNFLMKGSDHLAHSWGGLGRPGCGQDDQTLLCFSLLWKSYHKCCIGNRFLSFMNCYNMPSHVAFIATAI